MATNLEAGGRAPEMVPIGNETSERIVRTMIFAVPPVALVFAGWIAWGGALRWTDLLVLAITYVLTGLGITVGYHRLFTHRSFKAARGTRAVFAVFGSMAVEGPLIEWVATHRKHHQFSDAPGDPHSPHVDHAPGWRGALRGLAHAHIGWIFRGKDKANPARYAKDLLADRDMVFISRTFPLWVLAGLALPFGLGVAFTGTVAGGLTGLLWGVPFASSFCTTQPSASTHCATASDGGRSRPETRRAISPGLLRSPSVRPGTTTITPSRPPRATGSPVTRSTQAAG